MSIATAKPAKPKPVKAGKPGPRALSQVSSFVSEIVPGAIASQKKYGVPASVTIAQAILESDWGRSGLAKDAHNLFGIKGEGPAGSVTLPTEEFVNGHYVTIDAEFRKYHNDAESIDDHAELLATSSYYKKAMADKANPDKFADDLTGIYATDPQYGTKLKQLMKEYDLYRYDDGHAPKPGRTYTVEAGDTMSSIACKHGVTLDELEKANPQIHNPNLIHPGDTINLPPGAKTPTGTGKNAAEIARSSRTPNPAMSSASMAPAAITSTWSSSTPG